MPAAVDHPATREQVRLLYIANGGNLTLAAKTVGVPVDRAEKWKERSKVSWDSPNDPAAKQIVVSESVGNTANSLAKSLSDDSKATKLGASKAARKVFEHLAETDVERLVEPAVAVSASKWHGVAAGVHGWNSGDSKAATMQLQILSVGGAMQVRVGEGPVSAG